MNSNSTHRMQLAAGRTNNSVMSQKDSIGRCCKTFFPCGDVSADTVTDVASGAVLTSAGNFTQDAALGSSQLNGQLSAIALASGELPDITGKDFIFIAAGKAVDDASFARIHMLSFGRDSDNAEVNITSGNVLGTQEHTGSFTGSATAKTEIETPQAIRDGDSFVQALIGDRDGNLTLRVTGDKNFTRTVSIDGVTGANITKYILWFGLKLQGFSIFAFKNGLPSDSLAGIDWMGDDWRSKKDGSLRLIYPEWVSVE